MLAYLTCRLIVAPAAAWQELAAPDAELRLPSPVLHCAAVGGVSSVFSALACALRPGADFSSVLRLTLAAIGGWVGAGAAAVWLAPSLITPHAGREANPHLTRFASVACLPVAAGGLTGLLSFGLIFNLAIIAVLGMLAYRSGSLGAQTLLGLQGAERRRAASVTALVSTLPALLAALICALR